MAPLVRPVLHGRICFPEMLQIQKGEAPTGSGHTCTRQLVFPVSIKLGTHGSTAAAAAASWPVAAFPRHCVGCMRRGGRGGGRLFFLLPRQQRGGSGGRG